MEYFYSVKSHQTENMFSESYKCTYFLGKLAKARVILRAIMWMIVTYYAIRLTIVAVNYPSLQNYLIVGVFWLVSASALIVFCFRSRIYARRQMKQCCTIAGKSEIYSEAFFYEDHFVYCSALYKAAEEVPYIAINDIRETPNYYCIITSSSYVYTLEKNGFEGNKAVEAYEFLCSKINKKR